MISTSGRSPFGGSASVQIRIRSSRKRKSEDLHPELAGGFFCFLWFADEDPKLVRGKSSHSDLIRRPRSAEELVDQVKRPFWTSTWPCRRDIDARSRPIGAKNALQGSAGSRTRSGQVCIMSGVMPRRRKINTRAGRVAARKRIRELVSEHDDQVVMLIWGGRILGWSLRRIAASLEGSISPPGRRAGYMAGHWTAATVQRICRRHGIPTDRPADPPRWFLSYARRYPDSNH